MTAALLMAVALASAVDTEPAHAAPVTFISTAINQAGGNCMDLPGSAATNGFQLITWSCHGGANQNFTFVPVSGSTDNYNIRTVPDLGQSPALHASIRRVTPSRFGKSASGP